MRTDHQTMKDQVAQGARSSVFSDLQQCGYAPPPLFAHPISDLFGEFGGNWFSLWRGVALHTPLQLRHMFMTSALFAAHIDWHLPHLLIPKRLTGWKLLQPLAATLSAALGHVALLLKRSTTCRTVGSPSLRWPPLATPFASSWGCGNLFQCCWQCDLYFRCGLL